MLKGHVFKNQTFANEVFAHFINTFLGGNMGITKGCTLSNTSSSVTIGAGYFCIKGRFLEIIGNETISNISEVGYYSLICEVDLSQTNASTQFNQASIKVIRNASAYPILTQEDLNNEGNVYQYEFARFRVINSSITDFTDRRSFLNFDSIYEQIDSRFEDLLDELVDELNGVQDRTGLMLADDIKIISGTTSLTTQNNDGNYEKVFSIAYPTGYSQENCTIIGFKYQDTFNSMDDYGHFCKVQSDGIYASMNLPNAVSYKAELWGNYILIKLASKRRIDTLNYWFTFSKK